MDDFATELNALINAHADATEALRAKFRADVQALTEKYTA